MTVDKLWKSSTEAHYSLTLVTKSGSGQGSLHVKQEGSHEMSQTPQEVFPRGHIFLLGYLVMPPVFCFLPDTKGVPSSTPHPPTRCFPILHEAIPVAWGLGETSPVCVEALGGWLLSLTGLVSRPLLITLILCTL